VLGKIFESLYLKVFVNIVVKRATSTVYVEVRSKSGVVDSFEEVFKTTGVNREMQEFVSERVAESPYHYVSILDSSSSQGAVPTCLKNKISLYQDLSSSECKCFENSWTHYTSQEDLYEIERRYERVGIDFIFSPFVLLADFFSDKIYDHTAMFLLIEENYVTLSVFENSKLLFAEHLDLHHAKEGEEFLAYEEIEDEEEMDMEDEGIDLEDIDAIDDLDMLDDFGDIEDLDSIEDIDEFSESKDIEEEFHQELEKEESETKPSGFNEDYQRFLLIQNSVNDFYQDDKYESAFIENAYIADGIGISQDLKRYLEEEMFLSVYVRRIDLASKVCEVAQAELSS